MSTIKANRIENLTTTNGGIDINNSGNVGISTSSPTTPLSVRTSSSISTYGNVSAQFSDNSTGTLYVQHSSGKVQLGSDTAFSFGSGGAATERMRILSNGGLTFNGDTAAANALDDYEQGSWTPVFGDSGFTYTNQYGRYTKIGNRVWFNFFLTWSANTASGNASIHGLPFSQGANAFQYYGACSMTNNSLTLPSGTNNFVIQISPNSPQLTIYAAKSGAAKQSVPNSNCGSSGEIIMSGHYLVTE